MAEDRLDKFIKDKVHSHQTPIDGEALWQNIQKKRAPEKRKKRAFWIWLSPLFLVGAAFLTYHFYTQNKDTNANNMVSKSAQTDLDQTQSNSNLNTSNKNNASDNNTYTIDDSNNTIQSKIESKDGNNAKTQAKIIEANSVTKNTKEAVIKTQTEQQKMNDSKGSSNPKSPISTDQANKLNSEIPDVRSSIPQKSNTGDQIRKADAQTPILPNAFKSDEAIDQKQQDVVILPQENTPNLEEPLVKTKIDEEKAISQNTSKYQRLAYLTLLETAQPSLSFVRDHKFMNVQNTNPFVPSIPTATNLWESSIGINFGIGLAKRSLEIQDSTGMSDAYLERRKSTESSLEALSASLDFRLKHRSGLYFKLGAEYEQINEKFYFFETITKPIMTVAPVQINLAQSGVEDTISGQVMGYLITSYDKTIYNTYSFIDIPISLGYAFTTNKFEYFFEGGAALNLKLIKRGQILDPEDNIVLLGEDRDYFKSSAGLSLMGSIGVSYKLNDRISLSLAPSIKYRIGSITSRQNPLNQNYLNFGVVAGLRFRLHD